VSYGGYVVARNITVEFESIYPDYWRKLKNSYYKVSVNGDKVTIQYNNKTILRISYFLLTRGQYPYKLKPERIIPTNPTTSYTLGVNQSIILGVKVVDKYNNPVREVEINITVSNESVVRANINRTYTDANGNAYVIVTSYLTGFTEVVFNASFGEVKYNITVKRDGYGLYDQYQYYCIWYDANNESCISVYGDEVDKNPPDDNRTPTEPIRDLTNIKENDNKYINSIASKGKYAAQRFVFKGLRNDDKVVMTIIRWNGIGKIEEDKKEKKYKKEHEEKKGQQGATIYIWNYTEGEYDKKGESETSSEFWFNIIINRSELSHYIKNETMIILIVQNDWSKGRKGLKSRLWTDYICIIQIIKSSN